MHHGTKSTTRSRHRIRHAVTAGLVILLASAVMENRNALAFIVFDNTSDGRGIGRWNAAPHFVDGVERSLDGGIRYSVTGGSWEAFHSAFSWAGTPPTVEEFQHTFEHALAVWEEVDPATGLGTDLRFVPDFDTPVASGWDLPSFLMLNPGAEIDLMATNHDLRVRWSIFGDPDADSVTLTSGVENYPATVGAGGDIEFSTNHVWTIEQIQNDLAHMVPFTLGILPADGAPRDNSSEYYDDNYDNTSSETAHATLTNSFADLINPMDPDNSPGLSLYDVAGDPGVETPGVDLLTEETPEAPAPDLRLTNDEFAARQFLYPYVPRRTLQAGDADQDLDFDQFDLVRVQQAAKYLTGQIASWGEGDWSGAPGGSPGNPPTGDGLFNQLDIVAALTSDVYLQGPYSAVQAGGTAGDGQTSLVYNAATGELLVDAPSGNELTSINLTSEGDKFVGDKPAILDGAFDNFAVDNLFKATFGGSFGSISFGQVLPAGLTESDLAADLSAVGSLAGGGDLGEVDLVYVPEPTSFGLLLLGWIAIAAQGRTQTFTKQRRPLGKKITVPLVPFPFPWDLHKLKVIFHPPSGIGPRALVSTHLKRSDEFESSLSHREGRTR